MLTRFRFEPLDRIARLRETLLRVIDDLEQTPGGWVDVADVGRQLESRGMGVWPTPQLRAQLLPELVRAGLLELRRTVWAEGKALLVRSRLSTLQTA